MSLPYIIEYILAENHETVFQGASQTIGIFPPGFRVVISQLPAGNDYAVIVYRTAFDPNMNPGVFYAEGQYYGNRIYEGVMTLYWLNNEIDSFAIITRNKPAYLTIQNMSGVNQYYGGTAFFLTIATEEIWKKVMEDVGKLRNPK